MTEQELSYKERKKAAREAKIIATAQEIFAEKGVTKASMEEIAQRVPVSKATLYRHFANKHLLFMRVVAKEIDEFRRQIYIDIEQEKNPVDRLKRYGRIRFRTVRSYINLYKVTNVKDIEDYSLFARQMRRYRNVERRIVEDILEYGMTLGVFKKLQPATWAAEAIVSAFGGLDQLAAFKRASEDELDQRIDQMVSLVYAGIRRSPDK